MTSVGPSARRRRAAPHDSSIRRHGMALRDSTRPAARRRDRHGRRHLARRRARTIPGPPLTAGRSGIHRINRVPDRRPAHHHRRARSTTSHAEPFCAPVLSERLAMLAAEEAVAQSGLGARAIFRGRCSSPSRRSRWNGRSARSWREASGANGEGVTYRDLLAAAATGRFQALASTASSSARWPTGSPTNSAPRARRSRCRPPARRARPRSSSASRRSGAARPMRRCASAPTAR